YVVAIRNFGSGATSATLTDTLDPFMTLVAGSLKQSPVAFDENYTTASSTPLRVNAALGVLANDMDPNSPPQALTVVNAVTTRPFDTVVVNPDGSFTFTPGAGTRGAAGFLYTVQNAAGLQAVGTAIVNVLNNPPALAGIEGTS